MTLTVEHAQVEISAVNRRVEQRRRICSECNEVIGIGAEYVELPDHQFAHFLCAGMAGELKSCPECFMISANCCCA